VSVVEIRLEQATPALVGYYRPDFVDQLFYLRPPSIKGIWRWTARALIAGVLYDRDLMVGRPANDFIRVPTREEAEAVSFIVGKELGLGYAGEERKSAASAFRLMVSVDRRPRVVTIDNAEASRRGLQRLVLLTLGKERKTIQGFEGGAFTVRLIRVGNLDREAQELAVRALVLALTIIGVGKGSRRGLGSFDIIGVQGIHLERSFREFMEATYKLAERVVSRSTAIQRLRRSPRGLPPMPVISKSTVTVGGAGEGYGRPLSRRATAIYALSGVRWTDVHNLFLRGFRSRRGPDPLTQAREAWILGLPRSQRGTGYKARAADRRASPILVAVHNRHIFSDVQQSTVVTFLTSGDWPRSIEWRGAGSMTITVDEALVVRAMNDAESFLLGFFGRQGQAPLWP